jgi:uncharacterized membrane protein HdeD (DUF308 family)
MLSRNAYAGRPGGPVAAGRPVVAAAADGPGVADHLGAGAAVPAQLDHHRGVLTGVIFLLAMFNEFLLASVRAGWRWAHVLLGVLFAVGAIWAFANPINAFWALASVLGLLLIFEGTLNIISSAAARDVNSTWWLGLVAGILEILLGFWASQQMFPARAALLLLWVGFFALFRGISEIVIAFELRSRQHA